MQEYLGQIKTLQQEFNEMMPFSTDVAQQEVDHGKFFMVFALAGLPTKLNSVRNQILANLGVPTMDTIFEQLIQISAPLSIPNNSTTSTDCAILAT